MGPVRDRRRLRYASPGRNGIGATRRTPDAAWPTTVILPLSVPYCVTATQRLAYSRSAFAHRVSAWPEFPGQSKLPLDSGERENIAGVNPPILYVLFGISESRNVAPFTESSSCSRIWLACPRLPCRLHPYVRLRSCHGGVYSAPNEFFDEVAALRDEILSQRESQKTAQGRATAIPLGPIASFHADPRYDGMNGRGRRHLGTYPLAWSNYSDSRAASDYLDPFPGSCGIARSLRHSDPLRPAGHYLGGEPAAEYRHSHRTGGFPDHH
jgi:hypothetical protein